MIRTKYFALSWGYQINSDCPFGFTVALGHRAVTESGSPRYRFIFGVYWDYPKILWAHQDWAINEPGDLRGMPLPRRGIPSSLWTGNEYRIAGFGWYRGWHWRRYD